MNKALLPLLLLGLWLLPAAGAAAQTTTHVTNPYRNLLYDDPLTPRGSTLTAPPWLDVAGQFRLRLDTFRNLDLDRGPTPTTGATVAGTNPGVGGDFSGADMRLLLEPALHLGPEVTLRVGLVLFDDLALGSTPQSYPASANVPMPAGSTSQTSPQAGLNSVHDAVAISALSVEWLSPVGLFLAGRTQGDWGLGMVANSGRGADCDAIQSVDRIAYITSLFDTLIALSYDFDANGGHAGSWGNPAGSLHDLSDRDDLRTVNLAISHYKIPAVTARALAAGKVIFHWGAAFSYRWQADDMPADYSTPTREWEGNVTADELVPRDLKALLADGWFRLAGANFLLEGEAAWLTSSIGNASLMTGVDTTTVKGNQFGGLVRGRWRSSGGFLTLGAEAGFASGDEAPGFGARPGTSYDPQPGDLDGSQVNFNAATPDTRLDNFRMNVNFHVDEILWRRLIGTVTDAVYGKATVRLEPTSWFHAEVAEIYSRALYAESAPGIARELGAETDLTLGCDLADGLQARLVGALLIPLDGFRNLNLLPAREPAPAWAVRALFHAEF